MKFATILLAASAIRVDQADLFESDDSLVEFSAGEAIKDLRECTHGDKHKFKGCLVSFVEKKTGKTAEELKEVLKKFLGGCEHKHGWGKLRCLKTGITKLGEAAKEGKLVEESESEDEDVEEDPILEDDDDDDFEDLLEEDKKHHKGKKKENGDKEGEEHKKKKHGKKEKHGKKSLAERIAKIKARIAKFLKNAKKAHKLPKLKERLAKFEKRLAAKAKKEHEKEEEEPKQEEKSE